MKKPSLEQSYTLSQEPDGYVIINGVKYVKEEPKEETFVISREQWMEFYDKGIHHLFGSKTAFVEDKKELGLEVGKWYTYPAEPKFITFIKENGRRYGIGTSGNLFHDSDIVGDTRGYREAAPEEVKEALTKEAVKRGFIEGVYYKSVSAFTKVDTVLLKKDLFYSSNRNMLTDGCEGAVFEDGVWAEIIPAITKQEAEQKLNCKII